MEIVRYGTLPSGVVFEEKKTYRKAGTGAVSPDDTRLVELAGEEGLWLLCITSNEFTVDTVETDKEAFDAYQMLLNQ